MMIPLIVVLFVATVPCTAQSDPQSVVADRPRRVLPAPQITSLQITGLDQLDPVHLLGRLDLHVGDSFDREALLFQMSLLHRLLVEQGYAMARVDEPTVVNDRGNVSLQLHVNLGALYRIGTVSISEPTQFSTAEIWRLFDLHTGDVATVAGVQAGIRQVQEAYEKRGYARARVWVESKLQPIGPDESDGVVDLEVQVDEGSVYTIGLISFDGLSDFEASVIRSELPVREGDTYSKVALQEALVQLQKNGRLAAGTLEIDEQLADRLPTADVTVRVLRSE